MKFTPEEFLAKLPLPANEKWKDGVWFANAFTKGAFELDFFAPRGTADLLIDGERFSCETGDALFVPAKIEHHFENMSEDFGTWVIFF